MTPLLWGSLVPTRENRFGDAMILGPSLAVAFYSSIILHIVPDCILFLSGLVEHTINSQLGCYIHKRRESSDQEKKKKSKNVRNEEKKNLICLLQFISHVEGVKMGKVYLTR